MLKATQHLHYCYGPMINGKRTWVAYDGKRPIGSGRTEAEIQDVIDNYARHFSTPLNVKPSAERHRSEYTREDVDAERLYE